METYGLTMVLYIFLSILIQFITIGHYTEAI